MKIAICFFAILVSAATAICRPVGVEIKPRSLVVVTDLPELTVSYGVFGVNASGNPTYITLSGSLAGGVNKDGSEISPGLSCQFGDGLAVLSSTAVAGSDRVDITTKWTTPSAVTGGWCQLLVVPEVLAKDLRVDVDGKEAFTTDAPENTTNRKNLVDVSEISFKTASTGTVLFNVIGKFPHVSIECKPNKPESGVRVYLRSNVKFKTGNMADMTEMNWSIVFPEK